MRSPVRRSRKKIILGALIIVLSLFSVWFTIETNNQTQDFLVANQATAGGSVLSRDDLRIVKMNLAGSSDLYLRPGDIPAGGYLLYSTEAGQLVPKSWVASEVIDERKPVVITSTMPLPSELEVGDLVDVWMSKKGDAGKFDAPVQVALNAEVVELSESSGMLGDQAPKVQVLVPADAVEAILDAIASKDAMSLVLQRNLGNE
jgi:hypothetical protein